VLLTYLNHSVLKLVIGVVAAVSVVSSCGASRPDTVTLIFEGTSLNPTSSGFAIQFGDWQQEGVKSGRYEVPLPKEWVSGSEVSISMVEDFSAGQDIFTDESYDVWSDGTLIIDEAGWDEPLTLRIGESVAYVDPGSWATFKVSPQSGRLSFLIKAQAAVNIANLKMEEFKIKWDQRQNEKGGGQYALRCGLDLPGKRNKDGSWSFGSYDAVELYFLKCWRNIETVYLSQMQSLMKFVESSEDYLKAYGKSRLLQSLESISEALEDVAYTYKRESSYLGGQSAWNKAVVYLDAENAKVDEAIVDAIRVNKENKGQIGGDFLRMSKEWKKHCVKDGENCK